MVEFAANYNNFLSIRLFLFFTSKELYPYISFDVMDFSYIIAHKRINKKEIIDISETI